MCENTRFSSLFAAGDVSRGGTRGTRDEIIRRFARLNPWRMELANGWLNDLEIQKISRWNMPPDPPLYGHL